MLLQSLLVFIVVKLPNSELIDVQGGRSDKSARVHVSSQERVLGINLYDGADSVLRAFVRLIHLQQALLVEVPVLNETALSPDEQVVLVHLEKVSGLLLCVDGHLDVLFSRLQVDLPHAHLLLVVAGDSDESG